MEETTTGVEGNEALSLVARHRRRFAEKSRRERGVVLVWFALMLIVLMGFAGFAVDLSNWWLQAERLQRAADSGAHAGVVYLPADMTGATSTARAEVVKNGYQLNGSGANATVAVSQEANPNQLRVAITSQVSTFFVKLLGVDTVTLTREAVAEYIAPVPMGSPENKLGNDPARGDVDAQLWVNVAAPNSTKGSGDRHQAKRCGTSVSGCTNTVLPGIQNDEYAFEGYLFSLKVKNRPSGQPLNVQVYDPAFAYVGDKCETNIATYPTAAQLDQLRTWYGNDAPQRYAGGLTSWCTGDQDIGGRDNKTTFIVREPDDSPWDDTNNPIVCSVTMPSWDLSSGDSIYTRLYNERNQTRDGKAPWIFSELFRQNVTICSIPAAQVLLGEYILQIRSNATSAAPDEYNSSVNTGGHNRMSIQVGFGASGPTTTNGSNVTINARGRLPIYANANGADTNFFLARILPFDAGRTLRISLYDISDVGDSGTMRIVPPTEFGSNFSGCRFANDINKSMTFNASTCTLTVPNGYYNERTVTVDIPIPTNYTCSSSQNSGCWIKVLASFNGAVQDTTTWSAAILGNPIRLIE